MWNIAAMVANTPYIRFNESSDLRRAQLLTQLIDKSNQPNNTFNDYHITVRLEYGKCDGLTPEPPPPKGGKITIFLGDNKHSPTKAGRATVLVCKKTIWRYFGGIYHIGGVPVNQFDPDFHNNLDGNSRAEIEKYLNIYYAKYTPSLTPIKGESSLSIIYLGF